MKKSVVLALVVGSGFLSGMVWAATDGSLILPNTFAAGTPAQASEVNANFNAVKSAVDDHSLQLRNHEQTLVNHEQSLTLNTSEHSFLYDAIASKQALVTGSCPRGNSIQVIYADGTVACQEDTVGVTGVTAGSGLSGGVKAGEVTLYVPEGGITSSHLANGSVAAEDLANEPGVNFSLEYSSSPVLSACSKNSNTASNLDSVTVNAPSSGYIFVSASGEFCTRTGYISSWLVMDDAPAGGAPYAAGGNSATDFSVANRTCIMGEGEFTPYAFQYVYPVTPGPHTYYLNGCVSQAGQATYVNRHPMVAMFFPTRY